MCNFSPYSSTNHGDGSSLPQRYGGNVSSQGRDPLAHDSFNQAAQTHNGAVMSVIIADELCLSGGADTVLNKIFEVIKYTKYIIYYLFFLVLVFN